MVSSKRTPDVDDETGIAAAVAGRLGVDVGSVKGVTVVSTQVSRRRRRLEAEDSGSAVSGGRGLLATPAPTAAMVFHWAVSLRVEAELAAVDEANPQTFAATVLTALTDAAFGIALKASLASVSGVSGVATIAETRRPSPAPTEAPTAKPSGGPTPAPTMTYAPSHAPTEPPTTAPTLSPTLRPGRFSWRPDNITITVTARAPPSEAAAAAAALLLLPPEGGGVWASAVLGNVTLALSANHPVLRAEHFDRGGGHYAIVVGSLNESTWCLDWHASEEEVAAALNALPGVARKGGVRVRSTSTPALGLGAAGLEAAAARGGSHGFVHVVAMRNASFARWLGAEARVYVSRRSPAAASPATAHPGIAPDGRLSAAAAEASSVGGGGGAGDALGASQACDAVWTLGAWDDPAAWESEHPGLVPGATVVHGGGSGGDSGGVNANDDDDYAYNDDDDGAAGHGGGAAEVAAAREAPFAFDEVVVPSGSGFVQLGRSVAVASLSLEGGTLVTMASACPSGWAKPNHAGHEASGGDSAATDRHNKCFAAFRGPRARGPRRWSQAEAEFGAPTGAEGAPGLGREEAEAFCAALSPGLDGHLARVESHAENEAVKGLCSGLAWEPLERGPGDEAFSEAGLEGSASGSARGDGDGAGPGVRADRAANVLGDEGSPSLAQARDPSCWIGLRYLAEGATDGGADGGSGRRDPFEAEAFPRGAPGRWAWPDQLSMADVTWRAWARGSPDNATHELGGERCAAMAPSRYGVDRQHAAVWSDERCGSRLAFVCERFASSVGFSLTVGPGGLRWGGGAVVGGGSLRVLGPSAIAGAGSLLVGGLSAHGDGNAYAAGGRHDDDGYHDDDYGPGRYAGDDQASSSSSGGDGGSGSSSAAWGQPHHGRFMGPGLSDGARVELWGDATVAPGTVLTGGDGAVLAVLSAGLPGGGGSGGSGSAMRLVPLASAWAGAWAEGAAWTRLLGAGGSGGSGAQASPFLTAPAVNATVLLLGDNATLRAVRGEARPWQPPSAPRGAESGSPASRRSISLRAGAAARSSWQAHEDAMSLLVPASAHDSPMRGLHTDGSGHGRVALPVTGSGRRPRLLNRGQVRFQGAGGPSFVDFFYEAGGQGPASVPGDGQALHGALAPAAPLTAAGLANATNATGLLLVNSSRHSLVLRGGGLATGGASFIMTGGGGGPAQVPGGGVGAVVAGVELANGTLAFAAPPTFRLRTSAERPVTGEERPWATIAAELADHQALPRRYPDPTDSVRSASGAHERHHGLNGTYRLAVRLPPGFAAGLGAVGEEEAVEETRCLPYHASAAVVEAALRSLRVVRSLGGATVRREGHGDDPRWGFGYAYVITFDAAEAQARGGLAGPGGGGGGGAGHGGPWAWDRDNGKMTHGVGGSGNEVYTGVQSGAAQGTGGLGGHGGDGASLWVSCQGARGGCGCSEVLARHDGFVGSGRNASHGCRRGQNSSLEDPHACTLSPRLTVSLVHGGGEATVGDGHGNWTLASAAPDGPFGEAVDGEDGRRGANERQGRTYNEASDGGGAYNYNGDGSHGQALASVVPALVVTGGVHRLPSTLEGAVGIAVRGGVAAVLAAAFSAAFATVGPGNGTVASFARGGGFESGHGAGFGQGAYGGSDGYGGDFDFDRDGVADGRGAWLLRRSGGANGTGGLGVMGGGLGGGGLLICGGAGFGGLDNALLLYEGAGRGGRSELRPSPSRGRLRGALSVFGGGEVRLASVDGHGDGSGVEAKQVWLGGGALVSGWATVTARRALAVTGAAAKRLRAASRLVCDADCDGWWEGSGSVWASEGSAMINRGRMTLLPRAELPTDHAEFGGLRWQAGAAADFNFSRLGVGPRRWEGYGPGNAYGGGSDGHGGGGREGAETWGDVDWGYAASRSGWASGEQWDATAQRWYTNPLCGPHCARAPYWVNGAGSEVVVAEGSRPRLGVTVRHLGRATVGDRARLTLGGGGDGDGSWALAGVLRLSGGRFAMEGAQATITGLSERTDADDDLLDPTQEPTLAPTYGPTKTPTPPTPPPSLPPSQAPTKAPVPDPSSRPTPTLSEQPSPSPTAAPTLPPTPLPTSPAPTPAPTPVPTSAPTLRPTGLRGGSNGTVEVTGGGPHQLADVLDGPRLVLLGGAVEVRSRFHELNGGLAIHAGSLSYTVSSARVFIGGANFTMTGGQLKFVEVLPHAAMHPAHIHTEARNGDRTFVTLTSELVWSGGTMRGNAEVGCRQGIRVGEARSPLAVAVPWARGASAASVDELSPSQRSQAEAASRVAGAYSLPGATGSATASAWQSGGHDYHPYGSGRGGFGNSGVDGGSVEDAAFLPPLPVRSRPPMRLEALLHLISYGRSRWFEGDVTVSGAAALIEAGVVWMEDPHGHTGRVLEEPTPGDELRRASLLTVWEDNDAATHMDLGGWA